MPIIPEEEHQHIRERRLIEDYPYDPPYVKRFFISNIFSRVFAHLIGWTGAKAIKLKCTSAGELKVATTTTGFEHNDTKIGNAPDSYGTALAFDQVASRVDVRIWDNAAIIKRSVDGVTYDDEIEVPANTLYSFDCSTHSINIKNKTATQVARYSISGWF